MPRAYKLTWDKSLRQWVKVISGRKIYFGTASAKGDRAGYERALARYQRFVSEVPVEGSGGRKPSETLTPRQLEAIASPTKPLRRRYSPRLVSLVARQYLNHQESRVSEERVRGSISQSRLVSLRYFLQPFIQHCDGLSVSKITAETLNSYREVLLQAAQVDGVSAHSTYQRFAVAKNFLKWCWEFEKINQLPRNTQSALSYGCPKPDRLLHFNWKTSKGAVSEVQTLIEACKQKDPFLELYVLLGLNCGFLHKDISDLRMNEARWKRSGQPAAIERLRSKSNCFSRHLLWGRTLELLKQYAKGRYNSPDRVFARADGVTPLITQTGDRYSVPIKHRLHEVFRSVFPSDKRSFTHLRKTGASYCAQRFPGLRVDVLYLAHTPQDMASQFYAHTSHAKLDEALCYMECDFGLTDRVVKRWKRTEESDE